MPVLAFFPATPYGSSPGELQDTPYITSFTDRPDWHSWNANVKEWFASGPFAAVGRALRHATEFVVQFIHNHQIILALLLAAVLAFVFLRLFEIVVYRAGFGRQGPQRRSLAARIQGRTYGVAVPAGSSFSHLQAVGARGELRRPVYLFVVLVVEATVGIVMFIREA